MRPSLILAAATLLAVPALAHADTFSYTLDGGGSGFSGTGTLTAVATGSGAYLVQSISGTGVTGLIAPGGYDGNKNLIYPDSSVFLDSAGLAFTDVNGPDTFQVNLHSVGTSYFATFTDEDDFTGTVPVSFTATAATPEPASLALLGTGLLGAVGVIRRRLA